MMNPETYPWTQADPEDYDSNASPEEQAEMEASKRKQKYPDGSLVHIDGEEWTVKDMVCREGDNLLPGQEDRGEDYNLYRLTRHNTRTILRWQFEIDAEMKRATEIKEDLKEAEGLHGVEQVQKYSEIFTKLGF